MNEVEELKTESRRPGPFARALWRKQYQGPEGSLLLQNQLLRLTRASFTFTCPPKLLARDGYDSHMKLSENQYSSCLLCLRGRPVGSAKSSVDSFALTQNI
jgi:hypothetical protein